MSTTNPNPDAGPGRVPGWAAVDEEELDRPDELEGEETIPEPDEPSPGSSSPSPSPSAEDQPDGDPGASSTPASPLTDDERPEPGAAISTYLEAELEELGAAALDVAGLALNRAYRQRTKTESRLWLATPEESEAFGAAAARIAKRHLPEEMTEDGDPADALVLGSVALSYFLRNITGNEAPPPEGGQPAIATDPAPPPPAARAPEATAPDTSDVVTPPRAAPSAPAPPVITPDL